MFKEKGLELYTAEVLSYIIEYSPKPDLINKILAITSYDSYRDFLYSAYYTMMSPKGKELLKPIFPLLLTKLNDGDLNTFAEKAINEDFLDIFRILSNINRPDFYLGNILMTLKYPPDDYYDYSSLLSKRHYTTADPKLLSIQVEEIENMK